MKKFIVLGMCLISFILAVSVQAQYTRKWVTKTLSYVFLDIGNTDGDPQQEILYGSARYGGDSLILVDGITGQIEWSYGSLSNIEFGLSSINGYWESKIGPQLVDVDNDGVDEIIFSTFNVGSMDFHIYCFDSDVAVGINDDSPSDLPESYQLGQNYPNPFNPTTTIEYSVPKKSHVTITIYNILGQQLATIVDEEKPVGEYSVEWDGKSRDGTLASSGVYFYALQTDEKVDSKKMLLLK